MTNPAIEIVRATDVIILDVDDNLYARDNGLHDAARQNICDHANRLGANDPAWRAFFDTMIPPGVAMTTGDLAHTFPKIVARLFQQHPAGLHAYFSEAYNIDYAACLKTDPALVSGITALRHLGKRVLLYTNGPASSDAAMPLHVENVLAGLGFPSGFFAPEDIYDLTQMARFGHGKPTVESVLDLLESKHIPCGQKIVFVDDGLKNLAPFKDSRVLARNPASTIWSHVYELPENEHSMPEAAPEEYTHVVDALCGNLGPFLRSAASLP